MKRQTLRRFLLFLLVLGGFSAAVWHLLETPPQTHKKRSVQPTPVLEGIAVTIADHTLNISAFGTVRAARELEVRSQVGGRLLYLHPDFEPGGQIPVNTPLLRIERSDYELSVAAAQAEVAKAQATIDIEQGKRVVAREEFRILKDSIKVDQQSKSLALRKPQLRQVRAQLAAATNRLKQAQLDLDRTELQLPYELIVLERLRSSGEVLATRELIGRVALADEYWIELKVRPELLNHLNPRSEHQAGSQASVFLQGSSLPAEVVRIRAELAQGSRLAGVIVAVKDPLALQPENAGRPAMLIGSYAEARLDGGILRQVVSVPRRALRDNRRIWVADSENLLRTRQATVVGESGQTLLLKPGFEAGDRILTGRNITLPPGTEVQVQLQDPTGLE